MPVSLGVSSGVFLDTFCLSRLSGFVHFQFDYGFVMALEQISRQLRDDRKPKKGKSSS